MSQAEDQPTYKIDGQCTAGQLLQIARHAQQLNPADVANKLRISEQYVKDLEADDFTHIGARIYVRGYLLSYAKLLGIPQQEMLQAMQISFLPDEDMSMLRMLEREKPTINISLRPRGQYKRHFTRWFGLAIVIVLMAMVVVWWQSQKKQVYSTAELDTVSHSVAGKASSPVEQNVPLTSTASTMQESPSATATPTSATAANLAQTDDNKASMTTVMTNPASTMQAPVIAVDNTIDASNQPQSLPAASNASAIASSQQPLVGMPNNSTAATQNANSTNSPTASPDANNANAAQQSPAATSDDTATKPKANSATTRNKRKAQTSRYARKRHNHYYRSSARNRSSNQNLQALPEPGST